MKRVNVLMMVLVVVAFSIVSRATVTWDLFDESYGSSSGQISFKDNYSWPWTSTTPSETLHDGYAELTSDSSIDYAGREEGTVNQPTDQWRMDVKLALPDKMGFSFYIGDNSNKSNTSAIVLINALYSETSQHPDTICNYNLRVQDGGNIAPAGFDSSIPHVYSYRYYLNGSTYVREFWVDDTKLAELTPGAGIDTGYDIEFGLGAGKSTGGTADIYYVRFSSEVPEPATIGLLAIGILGFIRRR